MDSLSDHRPRSAATSRVEWGVAQRALHGQTELGDRHVAETFAQGALLAALDGLGHGAEAAEAARVASEVLSAHARESVIALVRRCHRALDRTRGVVMSLASWNAVDSTLVWVGIGNVQGVLVRAQPTTLSPRELLVLRGGVVGYRLPSLYSSVLTLSAGDMLVFATDGVRIDFTAEVSPLAAPDPLAQRILDRWGTQTDDALVLVARFLGEER